jgi:hypothetical protein
MSSIKSCILYILNFFKNTVSNLYRLSSKITDDSKGLVIVIAFIVFIAISNYKEGRVTSEQFNNSEPHENNEFVY